MDLVTITVDNYTYKEIVTLLQRAEANRIKCREKYRANHNTDLNRYIEKFPIRIFQVIDSKPFYKPAEQFHVDAEHQYNPPPLQNNFKLEIMNT